MATAAMNHHSGEATKRPIFGVLTDTTNNNNGGLSNNRNSSSNSYISATNNIGVVVGGGTTTISSHVHQQQQAEIDMCTFFNELDIQFHQKLESLKDDWITGKQEQREVHFSGMMKMPKPIRQMTVREFNETFQCNLLNVLGSSSSSSSSNSTDGRVNFSTALNNNTSKKRDIMHLETPAPSKKNNNSYLPTPFRTIRQGETLYSRNGSPVEPVQGGTLVATVTKKQRGNLTEATAAAKFDINVGEGKYISLDNPRGIHDLDDNMKKQAVYQLEVLQDQMSNLMAQLKRNI